MRRITTDAEGGFERSRKIVGGDRQTSGKFCGYLTNAEDRARLATPGFRDIVAEGILVAGKRLYLLGKDDQPTGTFTFNDLLRYEMAKG